jgi:hypothetical protein
MILKNEAKFFLVSLTIFNPFCFHWKDKAPCLFNSIPKIIGKVTTSVSQTSSLQSYNNNFFRKYFHFKTSKKYLLMTIYEREAATNQWL